MICRGILPFPEMNIFSVGYVNLREVPGNSLQKRSKGFRKIAHTTTLPVPQAAQITFFQPNDTKVFNR